MTDNANYANYAEHGWSVLHLVPGGANDLSHYRARRICGWEGATTRDQRAAAEQGVAHVRAAM
jgi:hypothetical protein